MASNAKESVQQCDIAGAIALAVLEDIRINSFRWSGFPEIHVRNAGKATFEVSLRIRSDSDTLTETFLLTKEHAYSAAHGFLSNLPPPESLMEPVQAAVASLEKAVRSGS